MPSSYEAPFVALSHQVCGVGTLVRFRDFPVVANLRNGLWYAPPTAFTGGSCYFRSKDGHTRCWNFELRRLNLPFAETVARAVCAPMLLKLLLLSFLCSSLGGEALQRVHLARAVIENKQK